MATYLKSFRDEIEKLHKQPDKYCHWNFHDDDLTSPNPVADRGLCDCPSHKKTDAKCSPHGCHRCASTTDVLAIHPASEAKYGPRLAELEQADNDMAEALKKGEEAFSNLGGGKGSSEEDKKALNDSTLTDILHGYWGKNSDTRKAVMKIATLQLSPGPISKPLDAGCNCACFKAKEAKLKVEREKIEKLIAEANAMSPEIERGAIRLTATFWNTAVPVVKGSIEVVSGAMSGKLGSALDGAKDLLKYYKDASTEGGRILMLLRAAKALSEMKRLAMLGVIYFDQQVEAPTCQPLDPKDVPDPTPGDDSPKTPKNPKKPGDSHGELY